MHSNATPVRDGLPHDVSVVASNITDYNTMRMIACDCLSILTFEHTYLVQILYQSYDLSIFYD